MKTISLLQPMQALRGLRTPALAALTKRAGQPAMRTNHTAWPPALIAASLLALGAMGGDAKAAEVFKTGGLLGTQLSPGLVDVDGDGTPDNSFVSFGADSGFLDATGSGPFGLVGNIGGGPGSGAAWVPNSSTLVTTDGVGRNEIIADFRGAVLSSDDNWSKVHYSTGDGWVQWRFGAQPSIVTPICFVREAPGEDLSANAAFHLAYDPASVLYTKGDAVPNVPGATFTSFGVPAINADNHRVAFLGKWKSPTGSGAGIIAEDAVVAKVGDLVLPGVAIKSLKDPVINSAAEVAFLATLTGTGITSANDSAVLSNINTDQHLDVIAQEGTQAAEAPAGALWKSFTSVAAAGGGRLLFLGTMAQGAGGITAANATGLWCQNFDSTPHLVLQQGTTQIGGKTVRSFVVLKAVSGSPGQTHAFNLAADLVAKVTFSDGAQAIVHINLP